MQPEHNEIAFEWIREGRGELVVSGLPMIIGIQVSRLVPPLFEAYVRILRRIDAKYIEIDDPLSLGEKAILNIPSCEPLKSFVEKRRASGQGTRIKWRELAELLNVPFTSEISLQSYREKLEDGWCLSRFLGGTTVGDRNQEVRTLNSILSSFTGTVECFFRFSEIPFYRFPDTKMPRMFKGLLNDVDSLPKSGPYHFDPEYQWPSSKNWCLCSDYDLGETVLGGPRQLISAFLASDVLECLEVVPATRIDR